MKCSKVMKLLAADYVDGELGERIRSEVERHLETCPACRGFEAAVRSAAVEPFRTADRVKAPSSLRSSVMLRVREGRASDGSGFGWPGFRAILRAHRAVYATAIAMAVLIVAFIMHSPYITREGGSLVEGTDALSDYLIEQSSAFSNGSGDNAGNNNSPGYGTLVEEFLM